MNIVRHAAFTAGACILLASSLSGFAATPGGTLPPSKGMTPAANTLAAQGMVPINSKAKLTQVALKGGNVFSPGNVSIYLTIAINKPDNSCLLNVSVNTLNEGTDALNVELLSAQLNGGNFANVTSAEMNAGVLNFPNTGKYRVTVRARTDVESHCTGAVTTDFEIKRQSLNLAPALPSPPPPPAALTNITVNDQPNGYAVTVIGGGNQSCQYVLTAKATPSNDQIFKLMMVYEKGVYGEGKGYVLIPKPLYGYTVNVETSYNPPEKTGLQNCGGQPKLEIKLPGAPSAPGAPKKGTITHVTAGKSTFALGESIPPLFTSTGDACRFQWRVRKLPFINLSDDVVFESKTNPLKLNDWNLNNLGQPLTAGNWTIFAQPILTGVAPSEVNCTVASGGAAQVFLTVTP